jgi:hypothetical protein
VISIGTAATLAAAVRVVSSGLESGAGTTKRARATGSGSRGKSYGAVNCSCVVAATITGALARVTTPDTNIGTTRENPKTATTTRAMSDAPSGPTGGAALHDRYQPVSPLLTHRYATDMACGASARSLDVLSRSAQ